MVALSHLHNDHAGGLRWFTQRVPVHLQQRELEYGLHGGRPGDGPENHGFIRIDYDDPNIDWRLADGETELAPGVVAVPTYGHTPGHQSFVVTLEPGAAETYCVPGFVLAFDAADLQRNIDEELAVGGFVDCPPAQTVEAIRRLKAIAAQRRFRLVPGHDPETLARLRRRARRRRPLGKALGNETLQRKVDRLRVVPVPDESSESSLLIEVGQLRQAIRMSASSWWYPMVLFGVVAVGAGVLTLADGWVQLAWWVMALTAAATLTARFYRHRSSTTGVVRKHRRYWVVWLTITAAAFALPVLAPDGARPAAPWVVVAVGYLAVAGLGRSARTAVLGTLLVAVCVVLAAVSASTMTVDLVCGVLLIGNGWAARTAECRP